MLKIELLLNYSLACTQMGLLMATKFILALI